VRYQIEEKLRFAKDVFKESINAQDDLVIKFILGPFILLCILALFHLNYRDNHFNGIKVTSVVSGLECLKGQKQDEALTQALLEAEDDIVKWVEEFHKFFIIPSGFYSITIYNNDQNKSKPLYTVYVGNDNKVESKKSPLGRLNTGSIEFNDGFISIKYPMSDYFYRVIFPVLAIFSIIMFFLLSFIVNRKEKLKAIEEIEMTARFKASLTISSGIAHNFRNDLLVILGQVKFLKVEAMAKPPERKYTRTVVLDRIKEIEPVLLQMKESVTKVMDLTKMDSNLTPINMYDIMKNTVELFSQTNLANEVDISFQPHGYHVKCIGKRQSYMASFINILNNSAQAMMRSPKKSIEITFEVDTEHKLGGNPRLIIRFIDTGCGMDDNTKKHIFEPFFTVNKATGTGLGMSSTKTTIDQYGGRIMVEKTELGVGTVIRIDLPIIG
jgi:signal transduction histidine kinase